MILKPVQSIIQSDNFTFVHMEIFFYFMSLFLNLLLKLGASISSVIKPAYSVE